MNNQDNTSGWPLDMHQLKWALRHGQIIDGLENIMLTSQPAVPIVNNMDNNIKNDSIVQNVALHNTVLEERIDQLGQSLNREIVSLKGEFAIVAQDTALEEQIDRLEQSLNQEILSLKHELIAVAQSTALEEQINKLEQSLNQEIISLKGEIGIVAQGTAFEEQISKLGKYLNQEILSLRNEFTVFVQGQFNQEKAWKIAESEWKEISAERETRFQADIQEMQQSILGKLQEHFQHVDEERQHNDNMLRQEVALLTLQLVELQQSQDNKGQVPTNNWQMKLEERQTQLIEDVSYIQYVVEEIATRPQSIEAQQKLREKFFIREIAVLKEEIASACQEWKTMKNRCMMTDGEEYNSSIVQQESNLTSGQTRVYEKKRKRRH